MNSTGRKLTPEFESKTHVVKFKKYIFSSKSKTSETAWLLRFKVVGMTGFEPAASSSRTKRATKLRYIPIFFGGGGGIRTHEPFRTTAFRVRPVMTTSILLHTFPSELPLSTNNIYFTTKYNPCQAFS